MEVSVIGGGNRRTWRKLPTCRKSLTNFIKLCGVEYTSPCTGLELTMLVVIDTDCTGRCKSNYHTITTTTLNIKRVCLLLFACIENIHNKYKSYVYGLLYDTSLKYIVISPIKLNVEIGFDKTERIFLFI